MNDIDLSVIGNALIKAAEEQQRKPRQLIDGLFPFIVEASSRMSSREISGWLLKTFTLKVSQPTISRALRNPGDYWKNFAELVESNASIVARASGCTVESLLMTEDEGAMSKLQSLKTSLPPEVQDRIDFFCENWLVLSAETRRTCRPHFEFYKASLEEE